MNEESWTMNMVRSMNMVTALVQQGNEATVEYVSNVAQLRKNTILAGGIQW